MNKRIMTINDDMSDVAELNRPCLDNATAQLFRASQYSADPSTAGFKLRRVVPITIYIDGDYEGLAELAEVLSGEIGSMMTEKDYPQVGEWGPFEGSYLTTKFGLGTAAEYGKSFLRNSLGLGGSLLKRLQELVPPAAKGRIWCVMVIGGYVIEVIGATALAAALPVTIPPIVLEGVALAIAAPHVIEAFREALGIDQFSRKPMIRDNIKKGGKLKRAGKFEF